MKIGIFDPYLDDLGGGEKYMMQIAQCLSSNHEVVVFWDDRKDVEELLKRFSLDLAKVSFTKNIFSRNVGLLERLTKTKTFDVIIVLSDGSIPFSLSKKLFIHIQQPLPFVRIGPKEGFKIYRVNRFFCNSTYTKSHIDKTFGIDSLVVYPPVDIQAKKVAKENIILTVGRLRVRDVVTASHGEIVGVADYKKLGVLIDTFREMTEEGLTDWEFVLAVSVQDDDKEVFEALMQKTVGAPISFLVNKTNEELWEIYSKAKIYWHASGFAEDLRKHPEFAEHFGISTVEAMGAGAVPVVINAGGQAEIVKDEESGFLWNSLAQLKEKTLILIRNEKKRLELSATTQKRAKDFGGERFCKQIYELVAG